MTTEKIIHPFDKLCNQTVSILSLEDPEVCIVPGGTGYNCTLSYKGRLIDVPFSLGSGHYGRRPESGEVVHCLMRDGESAADKEFEEWCDDLGYDSDSISHKKVYDKCIELGDDIRYLLGNDYDKFREIAEDY